MGCIQFARPAARDDEVHVAARPIEVRKLVCGRSAFTRLVKNQRLSLDPQLFSKPLLCQAESFALAADPLANLASHH